ncbi:hypothetical protein GCM10027596_21810 [Nocardioides korecus]
MSNARPRGGAHRAGNRPGARADTSTPARLPAQRPPWPSGLPLTPPEPAEVAAPPIDGPAPSPDRGPSEMSRRPFVRPPGEEIDFARVVRRHDLSRRAAQVARICLLLAGVCLVGYLLVPSPVLIAAIGVAALVSVGAGTLRWRLDGAAVPRLRR